MPQFCRSASNKALLAEIWEGRITIVSEQGGPYMLHNLWHKKGTHTSHFLTCIKKCRFKLQLHQKKEDMFQKLALDCIVHMVWYITSKYSGTRLRLGTSLGQHMFQIRSRNLPLLAQVCRGVVLAYIWAAAQPCVMSAADISHQRHISWQWWAHNSAPKHIYQTSAMYTWD